ncbi:hypothetical protein M2265_003131 [Sphingobacterium kitahiroshimense]|nr:hypothetical protein [Sphingobacterium kitahiroshimense]
MKKSKFTEEEIASAIQQFRTVPERKKYAGKCEFHRRRF